MTITSDQYRSDQYRSRTDVEPDPVPRREPVVWGDPAGGPLPLERAEAFERDGFLVFEEMLGPDERVRLEQDLDRTVARSDLGDERVVCEPDSEIIRSIFDVHELSPMVGDIATDPRVLGPVRQILGSEAYLHQSRVNFKPGIRGKEFFWHSDYETWHFEDGLPAMRAVSVSINLTDNLEYNGSLMIIPGSHRTFVGCAGETPHEHYRHSLRAQNYGVPSDAALTDLTRRHGITQITAPAGSALLFDSNCMHGSNGNITPYSRTNVFLVYNSVENALVEPYGGTEPRPEHIAHRTVTPLRMR